MIIISAGMQKSGSAYIYNIINDLVAISGGIDARQIKDRYGLGEIMLWHNNNVGQLKNSHLLKLAYISLKENTFAVKTHSGPTTLLNFLMRLGIAKTVYIYRDPRDVLLSAIDHGKKIVSQGESHTFARMVDFNDALRNVKSWVKIFRQYNDCPNVKMVRYEDLMMSKEKIMKEVCDYLGLKVANSDLQTTLLRYDKDNPNADMSALHFNKAIVNRFESEMPEDQQATFIKDLGGELRMMGYKV